MDLASTLGALADLAEAQAQLKLAEAQLVQAQQAHARAKDTASKIQRKQ